MKKVTSVSISLPEETTKFLHFDAKDGQTIFTVIIPDYVYNDIYKKAVTEVHHKNWIKIKGGKENV